VSAYIGAMPFLCLQVDGVSGSESLRGFIERSAIALLSNYNVDEIDGPTSGWLGHYSDRMKVRKAGLWNQNHVDESFDPAFLDELERLISLMDRQR
jgi:hypothetical protein